MVPTILSAAGLSLPTTLQGHVLPLDGDPAPARQSVFSEENFEGNVLQAISRTLKEAVVFDAAGVTSLDWAGYPILTFPEVPDAVDIVLLEGRDNPPLGAGEPATCPVPAAIANAVFDATGVRLRTVPFTPDRVREELARA